MNFKILLFLLFFSFQTSYGQEIKINSPVVATAGNNDTNELNSAPVNISKWRLGEVYLITLPLNNVNKISEPDWQLSIYPNPFRNNLNLDFNTVEKYECTISVTDITGKRNWYIEEKTILPTQIVEIDLSQLKPAMYLLTVVKKNGEKKWISKIQKY